MAETMRALVIDRTGDADELHLADVPRPRRISDEVLVRVVAAGVNPIDVKTRGGRGVSAAITSYPAVLGNDFAGVVEAVPYAAHPLQPGDRVYGMGREGEEGNVRLCAFSETRFVDDLRTARAVIAGGGFTLLSEAVSLQIPLLSIPVRQQYEQELNARYLAHLNYGAWARSIDKDAVVQFLERLDDYAQSLRAYERRDNSMTLACVDELIERRARGEKRPVRLSAPAMGKYQ